MDAQIIIIEVIKQYLKCITCLYTKQCNLVYNNILVIKITFEINI